ncbi:MULTISPECIES: FUSC family protein [unclassified Bradyrhizobium]|uniref:FUSC family protein n=1 Tax=unclassified Bradyrhizobium TaxID=2631580 RepID=UPI00140CFCF8|nr:FUSC family protein [Bradyrhizobium sp. 2S1]
MLNDSYKARAKAHLGEALRWNPETEIEFGEGIVAGLGFVGPIILAAMLGNLSLGLAASAGSLPIAPQAAGRRAGEQARGIALALLPTIGAAGLAVALTDAGCAGRILVVLLAGGAAIVGGYSRTAAIVTTRFTLFLIITLSLAATMSHRLLLMLLLTGGAVWTALLWLLFGMFARTMRGSQVVEEVRPSSTRAEKFARWSASIRQFSGLQYALKLVFCLAAAALFDIAYPGHHLHWISLTVVLLAQRRTDLMPVKITQRALGAALGGIVAGLGVAAHPPVGLLIAGIGLIAGTRPLLKMRHYLSYSAMMTTLIVLMMDFEQPLEASVLVDRTIATLIGGGLVIVANLAGERIATRLARQQP